MCKIIVVLSLVVLLSVVEGYQRMFNSCNDFKLANGRMRIKPKGRLAKFQCNRGFTLAGEKYSYCNRGKFDVQPPVCVKPTCVKIKQISNGLILPLYNGGAVTFYCKPGFTMRGSNISYCDGTRWSHNLPACISTHLATPTSCDFETEDLCGWSHDLNHDFDWRRQNFQTPSGHIGTGPKSDHTKGINQDGYYMYIESTSRLENDTARLISPLYPPYKNGVCFTFWYHMYGRDIGQLKVYIQKESDQVWGTFPRGMKPLWTERGNQGDMWHRGKVVLEDGVNENFQIIIEGVRGESYVSDIAIDDVTLLDVCPDNEDIYEQLYGSTTTDMTSDDDVDYGSCMNRCSENNTDIIISDAGSCECNDSCYERNTCCPDYTIVCLIALLDEFTTEDIGNDFNTETMETIMDTTIKTIDKTTTRLTTQVTTTSNPTTTSTSSTTTQATVLNPNIVKNNTKLINSTIIKINIKPFKPIVINNNSIKNNTVPIIIYNNSTQNSTKNSTKNNTPNNKPVENTTKSSQTSKKIIYNNSTTQNTPKIIKPLFYNNSTTKNTTKTIKTVMTTSPPFSTKANKNITSNNTKFDNTVLIKPDKKTTKNTTNINLNNNTIKNNTNINNTKNSKIPPFIHRIQTTSGSNKIETTTTSSIDTTKQPNQELIYENDSSTEKSQTIIIETDYEMLNSSILYEQPNLLSQKDKIVKEKDPKSQSNLTLAIFATCGVAILCIAIAVVIFMKYSSRFNRFRNSRNDSMSDVRFLATDEVLDFTWKTSTEL